MTPDSTSTRPLLWMLVADARRDDLHLAIPTIAWMAADAGALFECYLESPRDGRLFAEMGSTVLGGGHHQQLNYLHAVCDVRYILLGQPTVFLSSIRRFGARVLAEGDSLAAIYRALLSVDGVNSPGAVLIGPGDVVTVGGAEQSRQLRLGSYLFPEILHRRALAFTADESAQAAALAQRFALRDSFALFLANDTLALAGRHLSWSHEIDRLRESDDYGSITLRVAQRWKHEARGVAFGDPAAIRSQLPRLCRERCVALYAPKAPLPPQHVVCSAYTEAASPIADDVALLAREVGNPVLVGRQTGDGDLFRWSRHGVCIEIIDPNRPALPVVAGVRHPWAPGEQTLFDLEPDDDQLARWADEGKVLATLIWHSGEVAHNEAMLNLIELASWSGVKMGIAVHAQRYETCPQLWELIAISRENGGVRGLIEPLLHSGGLGVLAESECPPALLHEHCRAALERIRGIAGDAGTPRGYYAFMDSDLPTLTRIEPAIFDAIESVGLEYVISSAMPGRNRILRHTPQCVVINQSCRVVHGASPFVRITIADDLNTSGHTYPGWLIATLDAPVVAFAPYIWRHGWKLMEIIDRLIHWPQLVNVTPRTVARYARLLARRGLVPAGAPDAQAEAVRSTAPVEESRR